MTLRAGKSGFERFTSDACRSAVDARLRGDVAELRGLNLGAYLFAVRCAPRYPEVVRSETSGTIRREKSIVRLSFVRLGWSLNVVLSGGTGILNWRPRVIRALTSRRPVSNPPKPPARVDAMKTSRRLSAASRVDRNLRDHSIPVRRPASPRSLAVPRHGCIVDVALGQPRAAIEVQVALASSALCR